MGKKQASYQVTRATTTAQAVSTGKDLSDVSQNGYINVGYVYTPSENSSTGDASFTPNETNIVSRCNGGKSPASGPNVDCVASEEDTRCGYGSCKPDCLQKGNNSKVLLATISWYVFIQSFLVNGINNVNTTTLERRFDLASAQVAWVSSAYDVTAGILCIILGYVGTFAKKGRLLAVMAAIMATGGFVMTIPHLAAGSYHFGEQTTDNCDQSGNNSLTTCTGIRSDDSLYLYVLILGMALVGFGGAGSYILGIPWLDENIKITQTPIYIGTVHAFAALGPAVGFLAGGAFLGIHVDVGRFQTEEIRELVPTDPRWVGAWWIGYLLASILGFSAVIFLSCFPKRLPGSAELQKTRESQAYKGVGDHRTASVNFGRSCPDVGYSLKILVCNPTWILMTCAGVIESGTVGAFATFMPKVLQFQFGMSSGIAAIVVGALVVPGAVIGQIVGGVIPNRIGSKVRGLLLQCGVCSCIGVVCAFGFLLRCDMPNIAGVSVKYFNSSIPADKNSLTHGCNEGCGCTTSSYDPVCGTDQVQYFSPCHAGCSDDLDHKLWHCACIPNDAINTTDAPDAKHGICSTECDTAKYFLTVFFILVLVTFIANTGGHSATIRCVPDKTRSFSYGLQFAVVRFVGNVPGPIVFGTLFDNSCLVWQETCGERGACWIYDNVALAQRLCIICVIVKSTSAILFFVAVATYKAPEAASQAIEITVGQQSRDQTGSVTSRATHQREVDVNLDDINGVYLGQFMQDTRIPQHGDVQVTDTIDIPVS